MLDGGVLPERSPREGGCAPEVCMLKFTAASGTVQRHLLAFVFLAAQEHKGGCAG
jgi:hypothetical protein